MTDSILEKQKNAACYRLLASCLYLPEKDPLLQENVCNNLAALLDDVSPDATEAAQRMDMALRETGEQELQIAYAALFVGPFGLLAPPYGSVYLEQGNRIMGNTTMETMRMYREAGLVVEIKEPPDHIAIELEFMQYLAAQEISYLQTGDLNKAGALSARQADFFDRFLGLWVDDFCQAIRNNTSVEFYIALADCLSTFIRTHASSTREGKSFPPSRVALA